MRSEFFDIRAAIRSLSSNGVQETKSVEDTEDTRAPKADEEKALRKKDSFEQGVVKDVSPKETYEPNSVPRELNDYSLKTEGLKVIGYKDDILRLNFKGKNVVAQTRDFNGKKEITEIYYRGIRIGFFFRNTDKDLSKILASADKAVDFIESRNDLKCCKKLTEAEGSFGDKLLVSIRNGSDETDFVASADGVKTGPLSGFSKDGLRNKTANEIKSHV